VGNPPPKKRIGGEKRTPPKFVPKKRFTLRPRHDLIDPHGVSPKDTRGQQEGVSKRPPAVNSRWENPKRAPQKSPKLEGKGTLKRVSPKVLLPPRKGSMAEETPKAQKCKSQKRAQKLGKSPQKTL